MASSAKMDAFKQELLAYLDDVTPEQQGADDMHNLDGSDGFKAFTAAKVAAYANLVTDVKLALLAIDSLEKDGYPDHPFVQISPGVYDEIQQHLLEQMAFAETLRVVPEAARVEMTAGPEEEAKAKPFKDLTEAMMQADSILARYHKEAV